MLPKLMNAQIKLYTAKDTVTLEGTGFITGDGYFELGEDGWVILSSWDYSLFKGRNGDHPKILWSRHPAISTVIGFA